MGKLGDAYQEAVAQVTGSLYPNDEVVVGTWVDGPDGRRDLDVLVRPRANAGPPLAMIECKDWNKPIGIAFIDALESKRRDMPVPVVMICSNSGFTADALRKAGRVGIPALAALIEGDRRIRVVVRQQIYTRVVEFLRQDPIFRHERLSVEEAAVLAEKILHTTEWTFEGKSLEAWVAAKLLKIASAATRSRSFVARVKFLGPIPMQVRGIELLVSEVEIRAAFTVQWMTQVAEIGSSQGMYDYLRGVVVVGAGPYQFHLKNVNSETWGTPVGIDDVPSQFLIPFGERPDPGIRVTEMTLGMIKNMPQSDPKDAPLLDPFIDVEEIIDDGEQPPTA